MTDLDADMALVLKVLHSGQKSKAKTEAQAAALRIRGAMFLASYGPIVTWLQKPYRGVRIVRYSKVPLLYCITLAWQAPGEQGEDYEWQYSHGQSWDLAEAWDLAKRDPFNKVPE